MGTNLTTKGIPWPDDTEGVKLGGQAMGALANFIDFGVGMSLDPSLFTSATAINAYPLGTSFIALSAASASAGGWPLTVASQVLNFKAGSDRMIQLQTSDSITAGGQAMYYRQATNGGASPWASMGMANFGGPGAVATGSLAFAIPSANVSVDTAITFPVGRFTGAVAPSVATNRVTGVAGVTVYTQARAITNTGFTFTGVSSAAGGGTATYTWIAVSAP